MGSEKRRRTGEDTAADDANVPGKIAPAAVSAQTKVSASEKDGLRAEAIVLIKDSTKTKHKSRPFVPTDWGTKFKPALGSYKKFLQSCSDVFVLVGSNDVFDIKLVGDPSVKEGMATQPWKTNLTEAWSKFVDKVPKDARTVERFVSVLKGVKAFPGVGSLIEPCTSPKVSPAAEPLVKKSKVKKKANMFKLKLDSPAAWTKEAVVAFMRNNDLRPSLISELYLKGADGGSRTFPKGEVPEDINDMQFPVMFKVKEAIKVKRGARSGKGVSSKTRNKRNKANKGNE